MVDQTIVELAPSIGTRAACVAPFRGRSERSRLSSLACRDCTAASGPRRGHATRACARSQPTVPGKTANAKGQLATPVTHERAFVNLPRARAARDLPYCGAAADSLQRRLDRLVPSASDSRDFLAILVAAFAKRR